MRVFRRAYRDQRDESRLLWHGCIYLNVQMGPTTLVPQKTWNIGYLNIKQAKVPNIHLIDYQFSWFIRKNMSELSMHMLEKSRFKIGVEQNVKR